jgi:hypothetical protein
LSTSALDGLATISIFASIGEKQRDQLEEMDLQKPTPQDANTVEQEDVGILSSVGELIHHQHSSFLTS